MEQSWSIGSDASAVADALTLTHGELLVREARELLLVAAWCDQHNEDTLTTPDGGAGSGWVLAGTERAKTYGGHGTPAVAEFAAAELAVLLGRSCPAAENLIRDTLDLRERHPMLWAQIAATAHAEAATVAAGRLEAAQVWQARKVAKACHTAGLTRAQARWVDQETTAYLPRLSWGGFLDLVAAKIIEVDPAAAEQRRRAEEMRRFVATGQCNEHGLKTLIIKAHAGDVIALVALIDRIARILALQGDPDPVEVRRAKATGILANPHRTIALLEQYATPAGGAAEEGPVQGGSRADGGDAADRPEDAAGAPPADGEHTPAPAGPDPAAQGVLDLFADRRLHPDEPVAEPPPAPPERGPDQDPPPEDPALPRPGDLHPSLDDSDDPDPPHGTRPPHLQACPTCGGTGAPAPGPKSPARTRPQVNLGRLLPAATLVVHVRQDAVTRDPRGVARVEGVGPVTVQQAVEFLAHRNVTVKPVIDLAGRVPVDSYEIPTALREAVRLAHPRSIFPYSANTSRHMDIDHTTAYRPGKATDTETRPPGQTRLDNLAPLGRHEHRVKTHGRGWLLLHPAPGVYLWRTRHGYWFRVDHHGTHRLGKHPDLAAHHHTAPSPTATSSPLEQAFARLITG